MKWGLGVDSSVWVSCWSEKWMLFTIYVEWVLKKKGKVTRRLMSKRLCRANWGLNAAWIWSRGEWFSVRTLWAGIFSHCSFNLPFFLQGRASLPSLELKQNQIHPRVTVIQSHWSLWASAFPRLAGTLCIKHRHTELSLCGDGGTLYREWWILLWDIHISTAR